MKRGNKTVLSVKNLVFERSEAFALRVEELNYPAGTIVCLAGANGSGKTTFVECLAGVLVPDKGGIWIKNRQVQAEEMAIKKSFGFVPDDDNWIIAELTAKEYFDLLITIYKKAGVRTDMSQRVQDLTNQLLLTELNVLLGDLSHGNKKKVQIIAALLHEPSVIIVDEVRNGLDPIVIKQVESLLQGEARRGAVIVAATHDLWWAERFADKVVFLSGGQVAVTDSKQKLVKKFGSLEKGFTQLFKVAPPELAGNQL